jgi:predicted outer membrane protein
MKKFTISAQAAILSFCTLLLLSCSSSTNEKVYSASIGSTKKTTKLPENDLKFLVNAYSLGLLKINLANEAQIRSTSAESNQLARALTAFHSDFNTKIEKIAEAHGFTLPMDLTDDQKLVWKQLVKEKGWNFDKKFNALLEQLKAEEAAMFEQALKHSSDKDIKLLAQKSQPEFQLHETLKQTLVEKIDEKTMVAVTDEDPKDKKAKAKNINLKS